MAWCTLRASFKHCPLKIFSPCLGVMIISSWRASRIGKNCAASCKSFLDWLSVTVKCSTVGFSTRKRRNPRELPITKMSDIRRTTNGLRARKNPSFWKASWYAASINKCVFLRPLVLSPHPNLRFLRVVWIR